MTSEAQVHGASGVAAVTGELRNFSGSTEFLFVGSCVHSDSPTGSFFTSAGNAQELYCYRDAGYQSLQHTFGNIAYSMGVGGGLSGAFESLRRGEIKEYSDISNATRHKALDRLVSQARECKANSVVGIRTTILPWHGTHEMLMTGAAARNPALPPEADRAPVANDLTGEELWTMTSLGYAPAKLLMSTSIYSLGIVGGFLAAFKSFRKGKVTELTTLIHDARAIAISRLKNEADLLKAEDVVGVKTYMPGVAVSTPVLPPQAIAHDKDAWIDGDFGFSLDREH